MAEYCKLIKPSGHTGYNNYSYCCHDEKSIDISPNYFYNNFASASSKKMSKKFLICLKML